MLSFRTAPFSLLVSLPLVLSACSTMDDDGLGEGSEGAAESEGEDWGASTASGSDSDSDSGGEEGGDPSSDSDGATGDGDGTGGDDGGSGGDPGGEGSGDGDGDIEPGQLTSGEWSDLDNWDFWLALAAEGSDWATQLFAWGLDTRTRVPVRAFHNGLAAVDVEVVLRDADDSVLWTARTDNAGNAELWPMIYADGGEVSWPLSLSAAGVSVELAEAPSTADPLILELPEASVATALDLMFVVDTTGSMEDELSYLKAELGSVIQSVQSEVPGDIDLRLSVNFYRDVDDEYVVRSFPFTADIDEALDDLSVQFAAGGGDYPEAVSVALADAIDNHSWRDSARARLMFFILDAPPHDNDSVRASIAGSVADLAEAGVRVIPLGASGIDKSTEFLMRNIDIATGGTYTFLTNHSGIGGNHLEPTVGEYDVELLNDQMVRLIVEAML